MGAVLNVRDLKKEFLTDSGMVPALTDCSFDVESGEFLVVVGPSGCGKSTLLNIVGCLDRPTSGSFRFGDLEVSGLCDRAWEDFRRRMIGFLFQDAGLIDGMSALRNSSLALEYRGVSVLRARTLAQETLKSLGLADRMMNRVELMSGGERQRVALARVLMADVSLIVCDEPTASLDELNSLRIVDVLRDRCEKGATVVCASHDPIVIRSADRILEMERGRISGKRFGAPLS